MAVTKILSVGGSIVAPEKPDVEFIRRFTAMIRSWLEEDKDRRLILVVGGGGPARVYQKAYLEIISDSSASSAGKNSDNSGKGRTGKNDPKSNECGSEADWIGIMATRLNAQLLKACVGHLCAQEVVYDPLSVDEFKGRILVAAGWKPGFSTDNDAVLLAERFNADTVINLSNIEKVYTDDPKTNPDARPIDLITWKDFCKMVGNEWTPGKNTPFDPIASKKAQSLGLTVICASGKNIENIKNILDGKEFTGTRIKG
ncbi:UMP kinase [Treponema parvum]|uniref:amino acid kinase family protein n=1 Tax=Treponema parvum TaxID=138851 RepID=UPI001AEBD74D|nr:UMP kinase [Treponema parvum]QTQ16809.1 UMP kinase [Treponema parvum]